MDQWGDLLVFTSVNRLHSSTRKDWEKHLGDSLEPPTWAQLKTFLNAQLFILESLQGGMKSLAQVLFIG